MTEPFELKALKVYFKQIKEINQDSFYSTYIRWLVDSKYYKYEGLTNYLNRNLNNCFNQITDGYKEIYDTAEKLFKQSKNYNVFIISALRYVHGRFKYGTDFGVHKRAELWEDWDIAWNNKIADCETQNSIVFGMAYLVGLNRLTNTISCVLGDTSLDEDKDIDHFYLLYYDPKSNQLYPIDSTYWYDGTAIKYRKPFELGRYDKISYVFNEDNIWKLKQKRK